MSKNEASIDDEVVSDPLKITLRKPYNFEGKEYTEIDLSALDDWTCEDRIKADKEYEKLNMKVYDSQKAMVPESDLEYCLFIASKAAKMPLEFFKKLSAKESNNIKAAIVHFFNSEV